MFKTKQLDTNTVAVFLSASAKISLSLLICLQFLFVGMLSAEGTKQASPTEDDWVILNLKNGFAAYNSGRTKKGIALEILDPSEEVYIALSRLANGDFRNIGDSPYEFRITDSIGNIVHGPYTIDPSNVNGENYNDVIAGPDLGTGTGYDVSDPAFHFSPSFAGTFYIEFRLTNLYAPTGFINEGPVWWDFTVTDAVGNIELGRLWSKNWTLRTTCGGCTDIFSQPLNGQIYVLTYDGFVHYINFKGSGFRGLSFALSFNQLGPGSSGDFYVDRQSVDGIDASNPEYQIFFNDPNPALYEEPAIGGVASGPDLANPGQCDTINNFCFDFEITQPGIVEMILDLDGQDGVYTSGTADIILVTTAQDRGAFQVCSGWDRRDGLGNLVDLAQRLPVLVVFRQGQVNFQFYDVEYNNPGFVVEVIHPSTALLNNLIKYDDSQLASTDNDANLDGDNNPATGMMPPLVELEGCVTPCHTWDRNTSSQFIGYGESNTINTWWSGNINLLQILLRPICRSDTLLVEKTVANVANAASGISDHFDVSFEILVENNGTTTFDSLLLTTNVLGDFGSAFIGVVSAPVISSVSGSPILPIAGVFPQNFFDGLSGTMNPGDAIKVEYTLELDPTASGSWNQFTTQAFFFAKNEFLNSFSMLSDDPLNLTSNTDANEVVLPKIGLAKRITNLPAPIAASGNLNAFDVDYELIIENLGDAPISNLSLIDSMETRMGAALIQIVNGPQMAASSTATTPGGLNSNFTGKGTQLEILDNTGILLSGERLIINFTAEIAPYEMGTVYDTSGYLANQAVSSGTYSSAIVRDFSDTGIDPTDDFSSGGANSGEIGDSGGTNDPTLFIFEQCPAGVAISPNPYLDCNSGNCQIIVELMGDCDLGLSIQNPQSGHTYQWFRGNDLITGETNSTLSSAVIATMSGDYRAEVTNAAGCTFAETMTLSCCIPLGTKPMNSQKK